MGERSSAVNRWSVLTLFRQTFDENLVLQRKMIELERELSVWKLALAKADEDSATLKSTNTHLQQVFNSLKNDNPLLLCLVDGDGHIFQKHPSASLADCILQQNCLVETLVNQDVCTKEQFEDFALGFNLAAPLFSIGRRSGQGRKRSDAKIKVVLLRGYKDVALELKNLRLPELTIDGVFMTRKLQTNVFQRNRNHFPEFFTIGIRSGKPEEVFNSHHLHSATNLVISKPGVTPPPCTFFYLAVCKQGVKCTYGHGYTLTPANYTDLREHAKKSPCPMINRNKVCPSGDSCCSGHFCPRGENCNLLKRVRSCLDSMHTKPSVSRKHTK
ncbi:hypothetical protein B0H14DRAFT_2673471 [Mycena olivaceomarginata]|nr:hypothetical protein B0H14DRAFT_2673471 [Mycena olivaceomarginata]